MRLPRLLRTSVFQLTLVYMALFGVSVIALFVFIYWSTIGYLERQTNAVILAEMEGIVEQYRERRSVLGLIDVIGNRIRNDPSGRSVYQLVDSQLNPLVGNIGFWPREFDQPNVYVEFRAEYPNGGESVPVRAAVRSLGPGFRLLVGRDIRELERINELFWRASIWAVSLTMGLALAGGILMGWSAERRVARLNRTTRHIIAGDLSQRVPLSGISDEQEELAINVNTMLDQIENLLTDMRHVGDSIAHDLRSPLTRLRTRLELLAESPNPSRESIVECLAQADDLLNTFNALLRIARVESGAFRSAFSEVDMSRIVTDAAELYQAIAEDRGIELRCTGIADQARVFGDRELLAQAITNVLDNAVKYTPEGGRIDVRLAADEHTVRVTVTDTGPGIPAADRERVLARFSRLDHARSKPGNGLGLALVKAVVEQHDAKLSLGDNAPGLLVELELPAARGTPTAQSMKRAQKSPAP